MSSVVLFFVGVVVCLVGDIVLNLGVNIQKLSHTNNASLPTAEQRHYTRQWRWWLGMFVFLLGNLGELIAISLISPSVTTPLGSIALVSNVFFSHWLLKEPFDRRMLCATTLIILGAVLITAFALAISDHELSSTDLAANFSTPEYFVYILTVLVLIAITFASFQYGFRRVRELIFEQRNARSMLPAAPTHDRSSILSSITSVEITENFHLLATSLRNWTRFCEPTFAGLVGSQTVLFVKASSELVKYSFAHDNQFVSLLPFFVCAVAVCSALTQVHFLNVGLRTFNATYVVPIFYISWTLSSIVGSGCLFHDFASFSPLHFVAFFSGVALVFVGVWLLSISAAAATAHAQKAHAIASSAMDDDVELFLSEPNSQLKPTSHQPQPLGGTDAVHEQRFSDPADFENTSLLSVLDGEFGDEM